MTKERFTNIISEDEIRALFTRTKKEMQAGKYGRK